MPKRVGGLLPILILTFTATIVTASDDRLITEFSADGAGLGWYVVNDGVMGGRSAGGFEIVDGLLRFSGRTNTRGGGFSSIRSGRLNLDLSTYEGIRLRVLGDGRRYTLRLATEARYRGIPIGYWSDIETEKEAWVTVELPFDTFVPQVRGMRLEGPSLDTTGIVEMGLMIYDGEDGPFELSVDRIETYRPQP